MLRSFDLSSWQAALTTLVGLTMFLLIGIGVRLLVMVTIQQRRERLNRQINERLRTLISAYKVLGGSFTGNLSVDPTHMRDLHRRQTAADSEVSAPGEETNEAETIEVVVSRNPAVFERKQRIRDAVEAALSDIILLGTEEHVRLAERAARELVAGRPVQIHELVVSLRDFIRKALDLDPIPADLEIPLQGPTRPSGSTGRGRSGDGREGGGRGGGGGGGGGGAGGGGGGMGAGMMMGGGGEPPVSR